MNVVVNADYNFSKTDGKIINQQTSYYQNILTCFGYSETEPPVGDLLRAFHGLKGEWFVASPIRWQATHNDAMLVASDAQLNLNDQDALALFDVFTNYAGEKGFRTYFHDNYTWLIQGDDMPLISAIPVQGMIHQSLFPYLKALDKTSFWQQFITETQMLFNEPIPTRKTKSLVNGVWVWGAGSLRAPSAKKCLVNNKHDYALASLLSTQVNYFSVEHIAKNALLIFESGIKQNELEKLEHLLASYSVCWSWNNLQYTSLPTSWFARLFLTMRVKK